MKSRFRFYLKVSVTAFAVLFTAAVLWFVFRIEKYILARLPKEITVENLSVSFLNQAFVASGVHIRGREGSDCAGAEIATLGEATGKFSLKKRQLSELILKNIALKNEALRRTCVLKSGDKTDIRLGENIHPDGLKIQILDAKIPVPELGGIVLNSAVTLKEDADGLLVEASQLNAKNALVEILTKKLRVNFGKTQSNQPVTNGDIMGTIKLMQPQNISRLNTKKLRVIAGEGELRFSAGIHNSEWTVYSVVDLRRIKLRGEPFYNMPMGLLQLTPENMWPMVEDAPGIFSFNFKTVTDQSKLVRTYAADFRIALTRKVKGNLKRKIPVLPF